MPQTQETDAQFEYWRSLCEVLSLVPDEWCFVCPSELGDIYLICALGPEFIRNYGGRFSVIVKEEHLAVPHLFGQSIHQAITLNELDLQAIHHFSQFAPGIPILCHPRYHSKETAELLRGSRDITPLSLYRAILRLSPVASLAKPIISPPLRLSAERRFAEFGLSQGKTVILAPEGIVMPLPSFFWLQLASDLVASGYTVATLISSGWSQALPGTVAVSFPLSEVIPAAELAGWVIAARTGLCEVLSSARCRLSIIYPLIPWQTGTVFNTLSLRRMGLSSQVMEYEVADTSSCRMVIDDILYE
jgi:hypothetical protein